ncbi:lanthionine synthetase C family protein [Streptosporangium sp. NBC_01755]|uniref:lanthionine synthetase C family protein n=1 Tax=unclassified Streptosporangium TaxID=2632669 RepID=UPI002DD8A430|nr:MULTISPECIES: lanthionine synthetase C family protein [unclassified Streptosporangium]WSA25915.1 lanthionine synthetase C family protein [Streptosporangium sp. NBC_01810]WSD02696.1 lanthionine synthetase C family protein [Streptosporangium sp. NBC_01755]
MTATETPRTQDLSEGALGVALLHIERGDLASARTSLAQAVAGGVSAGDNASLFHGAPALEFVLSRAGRVGRDVRDTVDRVVAARLAAARRRQASGALPHLAEFDLVRGLTGLAALLLTRGDASPLLEEVLDYLVSLSRPVDVAGRALPGWWSMDGPGHGEMPGGHGNNGVAHGIAGPLAVLSLATCRGVQVPGQRDAIEMFACWLDRYGCRYWITLGELTTADPPEPLPARPSWCYGRLGIARVQQLAALALHDPARQHDAENTVMGTLTNPACLGRITDATLCHGLAGLLSVVRAVAGDSPAPDRFAPLIEELAGHLAADLDRLPKPGFMEGRAGAHLALAGTNTTGWARALLIA